MDDSWKQTLKTLVRAIALHHPKKSRSTPHRSWAAWIAKLFLQRLQIIYANNAREIRSNWRSKSPDPLFEFLDTPSKESLRRAVLFSGSHLSKNPQIFRIKVDDKSDKKSQRSDKQRSRDDSLANNGDVEKKERMINFIPTNMQSDILNSLKGKSLKIKEVADQAGPGYSTSQLYKGGPKANGRLWELIRIGIVIKVSGRGFCHRDFPPPDTLKISENNVEERKKSAEKPAKNTGRKKVKKKVKK